MSSSSPPAYEDCTPSSSQDRSERETSSSSDHVRKRRRIEVDNNHARIMSENSPPHAGARRAPRPPVQSHHYGLLAAPLHGMPPPMPLSHQVLPVGTFLEEDAALHYLASGSGFAQDLRSMEFTQPSPSVFIPSDHTSPPAALTSHPSQPTQPLSFQHLTSENAFYRPMPDEFIVHANRMRSENRVQADANTSVMADTANALTSMHVEHSAHPSHRPRPPYPQSLPMIHPGTSPRPAAVQSGENSKKSSNISLVLSRASEESIEALDEHKRECPPCCLEFEPNNFMAVITCCNTAMHARCLSAWVNSQAYAKNRVCPKCRRPIDAKYALGKIMAPVSDKEWDEGSDFNAPESFKEDTKIELNITARIHRAGSHRNRGYPMSSSSYRNGRPPHTYIPLEHLTSQQKIAILQLRETHLVHLEGLRQARQTALEMNNRRNHEDLDANRALVERQGQVTEAELDELLQKSRETREAREIARRVYDQTQADLDSATRHHARQIADMMQEWEDRRQLRNSEENALLNRPVPQLRVINGEPSDSHSP